MMRFACWITKPRIRTHTRNVQYLLLFHGNSGSLNFPRVTLYIFCLPCFCRGYRLTRIFFIITRTLHYIWKIKIISCPISISIIVCIVNTTVNPGLPQEKQRQILQWNVRDELWTCTCPITSPFQKMGRNFLCFSRF